MLWENSATRSITLDIWIILWSEIQRDDKNMANADALARAMQDRALQQNNIKIELKLKIWQIEMLTG